MSLYLVYRTTINQRQYAQILSKLPYSYENELLLKRQRRKMIQQGIPYTRIEIQPYTPFIPELIPATTLMIEVATGTEYFATNASHGRLRPRVSTRRYDAIPSVQFAGGSVQPQAPRWVTSPVGVPVWPQP